MYICIGPQFFVSALYTMYMYVYASVLCIIIVYNSGCTALLLLSIIDRIDHALSPYQPLNLQSGLLCSARYTVDQRWYRAKVVDHSSNRGKVKIENLR